MPRCDSLSHGCAAGVLILRKCLIHKACPASPALVRSVQMELLRSPRLALGKALHSPEPSTSRRCVLAPERSGRKTAQARGAAGRAQKNPLQEMP
jgi:hypothetical protein